jgi:hypothetical protein
MFDPKNFKLKSVYLPIELLSLTEKKAKGEYLNFSSYIRTLIVKDLKKDNLLANDFQNRG